MGLLYASNLEYGKSVAMMNVQFGKCLLVGNRLLAHGKYRQIAFEIVFLHQVVERLATFFALLAVGCLLAAVKQSLAKGQQHHDTNYNAHNTNGQKTEELQRFEAIIGKSLLYYKVGRRTNKRKHASHAACKGKWHKQAACAHLCLLRQAHHDRHHKSHRTRIANKGSNNGCNNHKQ